MNKSDIMETEKTEINSLPKTNLLLNSIDGSPSGRLLKIQPGRVTVKILQKYDEPTVDDSETYQCMYNIQTVASLSIKQAMEILQVRKNHTSKKLSKYQLKTEDLHLEDRMDGTLNPIIVRLNYPFSKICEMRIRSSRLIYGRVTDGKFKPHSMKYDNTVGYILNMIAKQYVKIYKTTESRKEYGVCGHELSDLYFEVVSFDSKSRVFSVGIGS